MRRLTRYVLSDLLKVFATSLTVLTAVVLVGVVVREAINQSLPPGPVVALVPYVLPEALRITIPVTLLLATTTVYGRMAGANELVAIKSLGISPTGLIWPTLVFALLVSFGAVWLNDLAVSWGRPGMQRVVVESVEEIAYAMLRTHKRYNAPGFSVIVRGVEGRRLIRPIVWIRHRDGVPAVTISAEEAQLQSDRRRGILTVAARNAKIETEGGSIARVPGVYRRDIALREASQAQVVP
ncbi:MAG TPA: LptF/LptG family permease [Planctomycetaceae bacterium]|nr:LptF/LptG family permease [Planctomycetaceae bacterium]HIQ22121.1 LptF/LptG family permease [Planctomycetota bacterium]